MDRETQLRRTINYISDFVELSHEWTKDGFQIPYGDYHQRYQELKRYLQTYADANDG